MVISTPGGMLSGVRPSLDGRVVVAEKDRVLCWKAGTRKPGSVTTGEEAAEVATSRTLLRLGANIVVVGGDGRRRRRRRRSSPSAGEVLGGRDAAGAGDGNWRRRGARSSESLQFGAGRSSGTQSQGQPAGRWDGPLGWIFTAELQKMYRTWRGMSDSS